MGHFKLLNVKGDLIKTGVNYRNVSFQAITFQFIL